MSTLLPSGGYTIRMDGSEADFGEWLQEQLDRREWQQADLARRGKFTTANVSRWINNERVPAPASCVLLEAA